jgi:hypothetical protein
VSCQPAAIILYAGIALAIGLFIGYVWGFIIGERPK